MTRSKRQIQKNQTRQQIIEAAIHQFAKDGLTVARTSDIATSANVSHGTVFVHFPTRELLLDTVIEEFGMRLAKRLHELVGDHCGMKDVLFAHIRGIREYEAFYTRLILEGRFLSESSRHSFIMIQSTISFHMIQIAEKEMKNNKICSQPVDLLFNTWIGLIHHYLINGDLFAPNGSVLERYGEQLIDHYLNLIKGEY
ncbi:TetR/AcrR family transcriptional regulator [Bacillus changyiensis]|uniref:TetR/AcrR family transcriptional regulator n=1 Tax=Bacillus changyiensis TaxID=3004103 RepID=UPI0022E559AB|nr:TetR/AcrR family transcriptional regulator [Bacillus changyiensis]MDA1477146.1 TetR/AcrR family transcriptional regulator [Bacillus changyiensis]